MRRDVWTQETLSRALVKAKLVKAISASMVGEILDEAEIRPHRIKAWCHSNDPNFQKKMRAIVRLYTHRPSGEPVLCVDEKTGRDSRVSTGRDVLQGSSGAGTPQPGLDGAPKM